MTPWLLIRYLGVRGAVLAAVAGNVAAALIALAVRPRRLAEGPKAEAPAALAPFPDEPSHRFALWMTLNALSGFCALSLELVWFRVMDVAVKSIAFTFGTVLCLYLLGNAAGTFLSIAVAPRLRRPLSAFLVCQCALIAWSGLALTLSPRRVQHALRPSA